VVGLPKLQALYRHFIGLDLDKGHAAEVLEVAAERERAEGRDVVRWRDLPLTKGLLATMERYERERLPSLVATVLLLVGYVVKLVDPGARKPSKRDIERAARILDLTL
jgi:hypothetical protein